MLATILKHVPQHIKETKISRTLHQAFVYFTNLRPKRYLYHKYNSYKLKRFKDIYKGQRCFIIGNGPSILQQDLTKLRDEIVFVANRFPLHPRYDKIKPTYYCMVEAPYVLSGDNPDTELYQLLLEKTGNTVKFFPLSFRPIGKRDNLFPGHSIFYIDHDGGKPMWITGVMSLDVSKTTYPGGSIIIDLVLPLAFYMGFSEFYLLGCDCDFKLDEAEDLSKGYFYVGGQWPNKDDYQKWYDEWYNMVTKSYSISKKAFEKHGRKIYNAGVGGKLEVFERVNYDELFPETRESKV